MNYGPRPLPGSHLTQWYLAGFPGIILNLLLSRVIRQLRVTRLRIPTLCVRGGGASWLFPALSPRCK